MDKPKQVCWNCCHCDTFGGICFKGKFVDFPKPVILSAYTCEEWDDMDIFFVMNEKMNKLKQENFKLKDMLKKCTPYGMILHPEAKCEFCNSEEYYGHKNNCEYIKLTKESEDV